MATRTIANGGGNWNSTGTWVENLVPSSSDAVVATATSGQLTINAAGSCASLDLTGYTSTITFSQTLNVAGSVTFSTTTTVAGTAGTLLITANATLTSNGKTLTCALSFNNAITVTFADPWVVNSGITAGNSANALTLNGSTLTCAGGFTLGTSAGCSGTTKIIMSGGTLAAAAGTLNNNVDINSAGTVTLSNSGVKYATGTFTYVAGTLATGTNTLTISGNCTLDLGSSAHLTNLAFGAAYTATLADDVYVDNTLTIANANCAFAGSYNIRTATFSCTTPTAARTLTLVAGQSVTVTAALTIPGSTSGYLSIGSSSPGTLTSLTLAAGATQDVGYARVTDIDSSAGQPIFSYKGSVTTSKNWFTTFPVVNRRPTLCVGIV